jgi:PP-loop superfamily ATP-utilizing enzyme
MLNKWSLSKIFKNNSEEMKSVLQIDELFESKLKDLGSEFVTILPHIYETDFSKDDFDEPFKRRIMSKNKL